jgi:hypothetical protein
MPGRNPFGLMMWMVVQLRMDLKLVKDCIREVLEPFKNHPSVVIADRYRDSWLTNRGYESITDEEFVELTSSGPVSMMCYVLVLKEDGDAFSAFEGLPAEPQVPHLAEQVLGVVPDPRSVTTAPVPEAAHEGHDGLRAIRNPVQAAGVGYGPVEELSPPRWLQIWVRKLDHIFWSGQIRLGHGRRVVEAAGGENQGQQQRANGHRTPLNQGNIKLPRD